jgi:hypothetical protein
VSFPVSASVIAAPLLIEADRPIVTEAMIVETDVRLGVVPGVPFLSPMSGSG